MLYSKILSGKNEIYLKVKSIYAHKKTQYQEVLIADIESNGKTLIMDNEVQTSYVDYQAYHEALIHPYRPQTNEHVLVIGSGEGVSVDLLIRRGWRHIDAVDIDHQAIEMIDKHLSDWNFNIYKRQNEFNLIIGDGLQHLKSKEIGDYSYVVFDLTSQAILLNQDEWIAEIHRVLLPNGLLSWQDGNKYSPSYLDRCIREHFQTEPVYHTVMEWRYGQVAKKTI